MTLEAQASIRIVREYKEAILRLASLHAEAIRIGNLMCDAGRIDFLLGKISGGQFSSAEWYTETLKLLAEDMRATNSLIHRLQGTQPTRLIDRGERDIYLEGH
jgi:hypothetical protein